MEKSRRQPTHDFVSPYLKEPLRSFEEVQQARQARLDKLSRHDRVVEQIERASDGVRLQRIR